MARAEAGRGAHRLQFYDLQIPQKRESRVFFLELPSVTSATLSRTTKQSAGRRDRSIAHGVSRGNGPIAATSPAGAKEPTATTSEKSEEMAHTFTNLLTHIIFSTKDRLPHIDDDLRAQLYPYMVGILRELDGKTSIINGTSDHVHLLVQLPPVLALSDAMRILKTNSSKWVHDRWPVRSKFGWQTGYGAFSVSKSNADAVSRYIADQEEHHRKKTFQEEFLEYLKKHEIEYDERYIWE